MPVGQFVGPKKKYVYVDDGGRNIIITRDATLGDLAGTGLVEFDPATPPAGASPQPKGFELRGVYWQSNPDQTPPNARKFLVCGTTDASLYDNNASQAVTVDDVVGRTTGRKGEAVSFI